MTSSNINWQEAVTLAQDLIRVDSYEHEGKLVLLKMVEKLLTERTPAEVKLYDMDTDAPYMVADLQCDNPQFTLLLQGHLDTVSPEGMENPFVPTINNGRLWGRGAADMKAGCASLLVAFMAAANMPGRRGRVILAFSTDEEYKVAEMVTALEKGHIPKCDLGIIAEPSDDRLNVAHRGNAWIKVNFHGKSAHASNPADGINANYMAAAFGCELREYLKTAYQDKEDELCGRSCMNLGTISGGTFANVVAPYATLMLDKRYIPAETIKDFTDEVEAIMAKCKAKDPEFKADYEVILDCTPVRFPIESPLFARVCSAVNSTREKPIDYGVMAGWGEAGTIQYFDIPALYYGPGDMVSAHTPTEDVSVDEIIGTAKGIYAIVKETCG
ncbi:M20/M25/M40 family metallo-hydrolase [Deltaproteobacteria bacterium OttesenSCG-928-M10]|nr:M20/M25/M40 family metallo-hydrolase [Deltaproteobacteria bacterium OttesenSCG-928-M10]